MKKILSVCLCGLLLCSLCACGFSVSTGTIYENAANYSVGDAAVSGKITALDIHWTSGKLILATAPDGSNAVTLSETSRIELTDEYRVHYWLDGEVLRVQYAASGQRTFPSNLNKTLTLTVPASLTLDKLEIDTASAEVEVTGLCAADVSIGTASGSVRAELSGTDTVRVNTASGQAALTLGGASSCLLSSASGLLSLTASEEIGKLRADTASGGVSFTLAGVKDAEVESASGAVRLECGGTVGSLDVDSASGKITVLLSGTADDVELESTSGDVRVDCGGTVGSLDVDSASGSVKLTLPADADFTLDYDTASGDFDCDYPVAIQGNRYVAGNGTTPIRVETASGNLTIRRAAK